MAEVVAELILNLCIFGGAAMLGTGLVLQFGWPTFLIAFGALFFLNGGLMLAARHERQERQAKAVADASVLTTAVEEMPPAPRAMGHRPRSDQRSVQ